MPTPALLTASGTSTSAVWQPDWMQNPFSVGIAIIPAGATTVLEATFHDLNTYAVASATWFTVLTAGANVTAHLQMPVYGLRLNTITALSTGIVTGIFIQATNAP